MNDQQSHIHQESRMGKELDSYIDGTLESEVEKAKK